MINRVNKSKQNKLYNAFCTMDTIIITNDLPQNHATCKNLNYKARIELRIREFLAERTTDNLRQIMILSRYTVNMSLIRKEFSQIKLKKKEAIIFQNYVNKIDKEHAIKAETERNLKKLSKKYDMFNYRPITDSMEENISENSDESKDKHFVNLKLQQISLLPKKKKLKKYVRMLHNMSEIYDAGQIEEGVELPQTMLDGTADVMDNIANSSKILAKVHANIKKKFETNRTYSCLISRGVFEGNFVKSKSYKYRTMKELIEFTKLKGVDKNIQITKMKMVMNKSLINPIELKKYPNLLSPFSFAMFYRDNTAIKPVEPITNQKSSQIDSDIVRPQMNFMPTFNVNHDINSELKEDFKEANVVVGELIGEMKKLRKSGMNLNHHIDDDLQNLLDTGLAQAFRETGKFRRILEKPLEVSIDVNIHSVFALITVAAILYNDKLDWKIKSSLSLVIVGIVMKDSGILSVFSNKIKSFFNQTRPQMLNDDIGPMITTLLNTVFTTNGDMFSLKHLEKCVGSWKRNEAGVAGMVSGFTLICSYVVSSIDYFFKGKPWAMKLGIDYYDEFVTKVKDIRRQDEMMTLPNTLDTLTKVRELYEEGELVLLKLPSGQNFANFRINLLNIQSDLKKIRDKLLAGQFQFAGNRVEPTVVVLIGPPGAGKSGNMQHLTNACLAHILDDDQLALHLKEPSHYVYNRQPETKYWDGWKNESHKIALYDDLGQTVDVAGDPDNEFMGFLRNANVFENLLHRAEIEHKGRSFFRSVFMLANTNRRLFELSSIFDSKAFTRRMDIVVKAYPKKEFCINPDAIPWERKVDVKKLREIDDTTSFGPEESEFWVQKPAPKTNETESFVDTGEIIDFKELVRRTIRVSHIKKKRHELFQKELAKTTAYWKDNRVKPQMENISGDPFYTLNDMYMNRWILLSADQQRDFSDLMYTVLLTAQTTIGSVRSPNDFAPYIFKIVEDPLYNLDNDKEQMCQDINSGLLKEMSVKEHLETNFNYDPLPEVCNMPKSLQWMNKLWTYCVYFITIVRKECAILFRKLSRAWNDFEVWGEFKRWYFSNFMVQLVAQIIISYGTIFLVFRAVKTLWEAIIDWTRPKILKRTLGDVAYLKHRCIQEGFSYEMYKNSYEDFIRKGNWIEFSNDSWRRGYDPFYICFGTLYDKQYMKIELPEEDFLNKIAEKYTQLRAQFDACETEEEKERVLVECQSDERVGKMHAKAPRRVNPRVKPQMLSRHNVALTQCMNTIKANNLYKVRLPVDMIRNNTTDAEVGYAMGIRGKTYIMPYHFASKIQYDLDTYKCGERIATFTRVTNSEVVHKVTLQELMDSFTHTDVGEEQDVITCVLPNYTKANRDITKHFINESQAERMTNFKSVLLLPGTEMMLGNAKLETNLLVTANEEHEYTVKRVYKYQACTTTGDCGAPLFINDERANNLLCGMHVAGSQNGACYSTVLTKEVITLLCNESGDNYQDTLEQFPISEENKRNSDLVAVLPQGAFPYLSRNSSIRKSPLYGKISEVKMAPAQLQKGYLNGIWTDPMEVAIEGYCKPSIHVSKEKLNSVSSAYYDYMLSNQIVSGSEIVRMNGLVYTFEAAIVGTGVNFRSVPRKTSAGYPYTVKNRDTTKKYFFGKEMDYDLGTPETIELKRVCDEIIEKAKKGIRSLHVFTDQPKDERRTLKKVMEFLTRLFSIAPFNLTVVSRRYFGAFQEWCTANSAHFGLALGVNPYGEDWNTIANMLNKFGRRKNKGAGDHKGYDKSAQAVIQYEILRMINRWYTDQGASVEDNLIREVLWEELSHSLHIFLGSIYSWYGALPSGHPLTALINCIYNHFLFRLCWIDLTNLSPYEFNRFIYLIVLGDDNGYSTHEKFEKIFTEKNLSIVMLNYGAIYTPEDKDKAEHADGLRDLHEITFLKRRWIYDPSRNHYLAPVELESCLDRIHWVTSESNIYGDTMENVNTALRELALHPREIFNEYRSRILKACEETSFGMPECTDFNELRDRALGLEYRFDEL